MTGQKGYKSGLFCQNFSVTLPSLKQEGDGAQKGI